MLTAEPACDASPDFDSSLWEAADQAETTLFCNMIFI